MNRCSKPTRGAECEGAQAEERGQEDAQNLDAVESTLGDLQRVNLPPVAGWGGGTAAGAEHLAQGLWIHHGEVRLPTLLLHRRNVGPLEALARELVLSATRPPPFPEVPQLSVGGLRAPAVEEPGQRDATGAVDAEGRGHAVVQEAVEHVERDLPLLAGQPDAVGHGHAVDALLQDLQERPLLGRQGPQGLQHVHDGEFAHAFGRGLQESRAPQAGHVAPDEAAGEAVEDGGEEGLHDFELGLLFCAGGDGLQSEDK